MMWRLFVPFFVPFVAVASPMPKFPDQYSAVLMVKMPYIGLEMPLRVLTTSRGQRIEYFNGLQIDTSNAKGTFKLVFNNGARDCRFSPSSAGPKMLQEGRVTGGEWKAVPFFPDLSQYKLAGEELVGGTMCQKFTMDQTHGTEGTMDDHISFYWDPLLEMPVRWHQHARFTIFGSHTDEYIVEYYSLQKQAPLDAELALPEKCDVPTKTKNSFVQIAGLMTAAHHTRAAVNVDSDSLFETFLQQHGKSYAPDEHALRHSIFLKNIQTVRELNHRHAGKATFKGNRFLDLTREEVLRFRGGKNSGSSRERRSPEHQRFVRVHEPAGLRASERPRNFDWRTARPGSVSPVKDQGFCGSCWTYGGTGPVEAMHAIQTGNLLELPEQFMLDCAWTNGTGESGGNFGCDGGDSDIGALEIVRKYGGVIPTARAYGNYLNINGYCKDIRNMEVGAKITGWVDIKDRDEEGLLDAVATKGPVNVNIMVPDEMVYYDTGVLNVESCKHNKTQIDHAVMMVGYGTDVHGTDYYVVRNSWSTYWGDQGYIKVARGENDCAIASDAGYPEISAATEIVV